MAKVVISLLGGRPVPNILQALHIKPDHLYIIASEDSVGVNSNYEKAVNALPDYLKPSHPYSVKPYVRTETLQQCETIARRHKQDQVIIALASEPKMMTLGAYDCATKLRAEGQEIDLCYLAGGELIWLSTDSDSVEPVQIKLPEYFACYGWDIRLNTDKTNEKFQKLVSLLVTQLPVSHSLIHTLRTEDKNKGKRTIRCKRKINDDEFLVLREIERLGVLSNVRRTDTETVCTIPSDEDAKFLLTGDWLEYYVFQEALKLTTSQGKPLFDYCGWGVEDKSQKGEIDFVGIFGGQMVIASCKTEDKVKRTHLEEIHSKAEQLGKGMCSILLVSSVSRASREEKDLLDYKRRAEERQI